MQNQSTKQRVKNSSSSTHRENIDILPEISTHQIVFFFKIILTDELTRDYAYGEIDPLLRRCRLTPWIPAELEEVSDVITEPQDAYYEVRTIPTFVNAN